MYQCTSWPCGRVMWTCDCQIAGSNLGRGYCTPRSTQPSILRRRYANGLREVTARRGEIWSTACNIFCRLRTRETEMITFPSVIHCGTNLALDFTFLCSINIKFFLNSELGLVTPAKEVVFLGVIRLLVCVFAGLTKIPLNRFSQNLV